MHFGRISRAAGVASMAVAACVAVSLDAVAQKAKTRKGPGSSSPSKASSPKERASGVILKVEAVKGGDAGKETHRLTINTDAVWRDWARDQSQVKDPGSPKKDATKGQNSVATAGEPADANSVVVVDIRPDTRVETRFRAPDDETGKGSTTPETAGTDKKGAKPDNVVRFRADDLKPGLFVEVDYRHVSAGNPASSVAVIRPIGGPDSGSADKTR